MTFKYKFLFNILITLQIVSCDNILLIKNNNENNPNDQNEEFVLINNSHDETKILFIGNSLTYSNQMPTMVKNFAELSGKSVIIHQATISGTPLRQLINKSSIIEKINSNNWDYVILQSDDITAFPDMYDIEISTLEKFKKVIYNNNASTEIIYQMIWGLRNGVTVRELNGENVYYSYYDYIKKIYDGTIYIANKTNLKISPTGWAWRKIRKEHPQFELFASDNAHPSYTGSYLTAAVHFVSIFGESCGYINFDGTLSSTDAEILRDVATSIVLDSLELWNLDNSLSIDE